MIRRLALLLGLAVAGCRSDAPAPAPGQDAGPSSAAEAAAPSSFSELPPGDTAAVLTLMRRTMADIDGALAQFTLRDTIYPAQDLAPPRHLTVWLENGVPRKLVVADTGSTPNVDHETDYWFVQGDVRVVKLPDANLAFDADKLMLWTDENLEPVSGVSEADRMSRENNVIADARRWLVFFGITLP